MQQPANVVQFTPIATPIAAPIATPIAATIPQMTPIAQPLIPAVQPFTPAVQPLMSVQPQPPITAYQTTTVRPVSVQTMRGVPVVYQR